MNKDKYIEAIERYLSDDRIETGKLKNMIEDNFKEMPLLASVSNLSAAARKFMLSGVDGLTLRNMASKAENMLERVLDSSSGGLSETSKNDFVFSTKVETFAPIYKETEFRVFDEEKMRNDPEYKKDIEKFLSDDKGYVDKFGVEREKQITFKDGVVRCGTSWGENEGGDQYRIVKYGPGDFNLVRREEWEKTYHVLQHNPNMAVKCVEVDALEIKPDNYNKIIEWTKGDAYINEEDGKLYLKTLENKNGDILDNGRILTKGVSGEFWAQDSNKFLSKYELSELSSDASKFEKEYEKKCKEIENTDDNNELDSDHLELDYLESDDEDLEEQDYCDYEDSEN